MGTTKDTDGDRETAETDTNRVVTVNIEGLRWLV